MPTSWKVTPHRYEHGNPAMTGDEEWNILDLDDDLVQEECEGIVEKLGAAWIRARLDFYGRRRDVWPAGAAGGTDSKGADHGRDVNVDGGRRPRAHADSEQGFQASHDEFRARWHLGVDRWSSDLR